MLSFEEFKERVTVIRGREADTIRRKYGQRFVDMSSEYFKNYIAKREETTDGKWYTGYLWDSLRDPRVISEEEVLSDQQWRDRTVYVLWDLHNEEKVWRNDYWKFPQEA